MSECQQGSPTMWCVLELIHFSVHLCFSGMRCVPQLLMSCTAGRHGQLPSCISFYTGATHAVQATHTRCAPPLTQGIHSVPGHSQLPFLCASFVYHYTHVMHVFLACCNSWMFLCTPQLLQQPIHWQHTSQPFFCHGRADSGVHS